MPETLSFQAEVPQVLKLMTNALYSKREIFLRELLSNASDALDKRRVMALTQPALQAQAHEPQITLQVDPAARTLTITDTGIGMSRQEVLDNLGTLAHSGTQAFLEAHAQTPEAEQLIGQFGVGFYASFMVADRVEVFTRRADGSAEDGVHWSSDGLQDYTVDTHHAAESGTKIVLHIRDNMDECLEPWRLRQWVKTHSDHIAYPVLMEREHTPSDNPDASDTAPEPTWEAVNQQQALWLLPKKDVTDEAHRNFYQQITHDFRPPLTWLHASVEGTQTYTVLWYLPSQPMPDFLQRDGKHGLRLYINRVFILDDAEQFLPHYLRFIKGVLDAPDLPLNISRETLQGHDKVTSLKKALTQRALTWLEKIARDEPEQYHTFWTHFGSTLKEGLVEDPAHRNRCAKLLRFASTHAMSQDTWTSLDDYIQRMQPEQPVYYLLAENWDMACQSPHLSLFKKKGLEVLLLHQKIDEWWVSHLPEYEGNTLRSITQLAPDDPMWQDAPEHSTEDDELAKRLADALGDAVQTVRPSKRLDDFPACVIAAEGMPSLHMQQLLKAAGQPVPDTQPVLEFNAQHPMVQRAAAEQEPERFKAWAHVLLSEALLSATGSLPDPMPFLHQVNTLLLHDPA